MASTSAPVMAASAAALFAAFDPSTHLLAIGAGPMLILGSTVGACFAIGVGDPRIPTERRFALKFSVSLSCGLLFTPLVFKWAAWPWDAVYVGPAACIVSALAIRLLRRLLPLIESRLIERADARLRKQRESSPFDK